MKVQELVLRFPEIPPVFHKEPALARFAEVFDELLQIAYKPTNCSAHQQTVEHKAYVKLISPMGMVNYGLATPAKTLERLQGLIADFQRDPATFRDQILAGAAAAPGGCQGAEHAGH